ncbi:BnaC09g18130D [Brassica napus]|uniref:BnaC09g18130D protein n=1 Tax=Brassica napus TaxID=3708 RepID=A0A078GVE5_BRANA|nr:BnaC09g18130D [Brassica napus]
MVWFRAGSNVTKLAPSPSLN